MIIPISGREENIVGKRENAGYLHFHLYPQCFQKASSSVAWKVGIVGIGLKCWNIQRFQFVKWHCLGFRWESSAECRARLDCTYLLADLALLSPQTKFMVGTDRIRVKKQLGSPDKLCSLTRRSTFSCVCQRLKWGILQYPVFRPDCF